MTFDVSAGERIAILGANGSGKSTLVRLFNGLMVPSVGTVTVSGLCTSDWHDISRIRENVAVVFQNPDDQIVATSVEDDIAFGPENLGLPREEIRSRVGEAVAAVGLEGLERREPHLLSGGQKQRLAIAGALAMNPGFLVLDEPTSMLDPQGRSEVLSVLADLVDSGRSVVHVTHDLSEALLASRAIVMMSGAIVFDGPPTRLLDPQIRAESWGIDLTDALILGARMRELGIGIPLDAVTPALMAGALCL